MHLNEDLIEIIELIIKIVSLEFFFTFYIAKNIPNIINSLFKGIENYFVSQVDEVSMDGLPI